jgi:hypothetical protein
MSTETRERLAAQNPDMMFMDGFDDALIGSCLSFARVPVACYDVEIILKVHMDAGMTAEDAWDFFEFNQLGSYVGEGTPVFFFKDKA